MEKTVRLLLLAIVGAAFLVCGCAAPGEPKGVHQVIGEGVATSALMVYDVGAMSLNSIWAVGTLGYGFQDGNALLPLYDPEKGKFIPHNF